MFREIREVNTEYLRREERKGRAIIDITKRIVPKTDVSIEETRDYWDDIFSRRV